MNNRHLVLLLSFFVAVVGYVCYGKFAPAGSAKTSSTETKIAAESELTEKKEIHGGQEGRNGAQGFPMSGWEDSILSGNMSAAAYLIGPKSLRSDRAVDMLKSEKFEQLVSHLRSESSNTLLASEHTAFVGDVLKATLDKIASATSYSCSDRLCLISVESEMDETRFSQWKSMFASQMDPLGKVLVNDTRTFPGGRAQHHMLLVTDPTVQGAGVEINAFPVVVTSKPKEQGGGGGN